jgi:ribose 5-phosphate isomerase B
LCCWTGTGVSIAANKVPGIRAALCGDVETARGARRWNDANVLAIGLASTPPQQATAIVDAWMSSDEVDPDERENIARVARMEQRYAGAPEPNSAAS